MASFWKHYHEWCHVCELCPFIQVEKQIRNQLMVEGVTGITSSGIQLADQADAPAFVDYAYALYLN